MQNVISPQTRLMAGAEGLVLMLQNPSAHIAVPEPLLKEAFFALMGVVDKSRRHPVTGKPILAIRVTVDNEHHCVTISLDLQPMPCGQATVGNDSNASCLPWRMGCTESFMALSTPAIPEPPPFAAAVALMKISDAIARMYGWYREAPFVGPHLRDHFAFVHKKEDDRSWSLQRLN